MGRLSVILSSGLGIGYIPRISGTVGTLWGVLLYYLGRNLALKWMILGIVLFVFFAVWVSHRAEKYLGSHDSSLIVIDEVAGYLVAVAGFSFNLWVAVLGFVLFRIFDIAKPPPLRQIDTHWPGGWGVVLDDVMAGIYSQICLRIIFYFL